MKGGDENTDKLPSKNRPVTTTLVPKLVWRLHTIFIGAATMTISSRRVKTFCEIYTFRTSKQLPSMFLSHVKANGVQANMAGGRHDIQTLMERNAITQRMFLNQIVLVVKTRL